MKSIAYFNIPAYGHIRPTLPVVEHLVQRGARVVYFIDEAHHDAVAATGADVRVIPNHTGLPDRVPATLSEFAWLLTENSYRILPSLLEQVRADDFGLILHDSVCPWGRFVAKLTGLPSMRSVGVFWGFEKAVEEKMTWELLCMLFRHIRFDCALQAAKWRRKLVREFDLKPLGKVLNNPANQSLVFTSREFVEGGEGVDEDTHFIGASFSDTGPGDFVTPEPGDRPLIYISLGTTFTDAESFYRSCIKAFASAPAVIVLSIGRKIDPEVLAPWPENFTVAQYVPQLEILKRASVFITQAGGCSVMESLWHGVPLVMWPLTEEHEFNMRCVLRQKAGVELQPDDLSGDRLCEIALAVSRDPTCREAAKRMGETLRAAGGPARGADLIFERYPDVRPAGN